MMRSKSIISCVDLPLRVRTKDEYNTRAHSPSYDMQSISIDLEIMERIELKRKKLIFYEIINKKCEKNLGLNMRAKMSDEISRLMKFGFRLISVQFSSIFSELQKRYTRILTTL
jgi:hypothetical protein